jgi:hypothetical protein
MLSVPLRSWAIYRNLPFLAIGVIMVILFGRHSLHQSAGTELVKQSLRGGLGKILVDNEQFPEQNDRNISSQRLKYEKSSWIYCRVNDYRGRSRFRKRY